MSDAPTSGEGRVAVFDKAYLVTCVLLFVYGILAWRGVVGDGRPWRPVSFIALSGGMVLQALASVVQRRSRVAFYVLGVASLAALAVSLMAR